MDSNDLIYRTMALGRGRVAKSSGKTAAWVPEFAVENPVFGRTTALVPEFKLKYLPLGRTLY